MRQTRDTNALLSPDSSRAHQRDRSSERVIVAATHGVLSGPAVDTLKNSQISEVVITNTLPVAQEKRFDKLTVLSIAPLIGRTIHEVFNDGSVTSLFDGQS